MSKESWSKKEKKILIVEDDASSRMIVKEILRKDGYTDAVEASSGEEAQTKLKSDKFDLVICDWHMPGLSGLQLHEFIKNSGDIGNVPLLMVTGETVKENIMKAIQAGVAGYIVKPLSPKNILDKVSAILEPEQ